MANLIECTLSSNDGLTRMNVMVTCDAAFAGTNIVCTNGIETFTQTCPDTLPYTVTFMSLVADEWMISGEVGGESYSTVVEIPSYRTARLEAQ